MVKQPWLRETSQLAGITVPLPLFRSNRFAHSKSSLPEPSRDPALRPFALHGISCNIHGQTTRPHSYILRYITTLLELKCSVILANSYYCDDEEKDDDDEDDYRLPAGANTTTARKPLPPVPRLYHRFPSELLQILSAESCVKP